MGEVSFDLWGNPVRPGFGRKGRPPVEVTERMTCKVKLLLALGWSNERIANAVGIARSTLERHFPAALRQRVKMRDRMEARRFELAWAAAEAGNVAAMRELGRMIERNDLVYADAALRAAGEAPERRLGKKDAAVEAALNAGQGGDWGDDLRYDLPVTH